MQIWTCAPSQCLQLPSSSLILYAVDCLQPAHLVYIKPPVIYVSFPKGRLPLFCEISMHHRATPSPSTAPAEFLVVPASGPTHRVRNRADTSPNYVTLKGDVTQNCKLLPKLMQLTLQGGAAYLPSQNMLSRTFTPSSSLYNNSTTCQSPG